MGYVPHDSVGARVRASSVHVLNHLEKLPICRVKHITKCQVLFLFQKIISSDKDFASRAFAAADLSEFQPRVYPNNWIFGEIDKLHCFGGVVG